MNRVMLCALVGVSLLCLVLAQQPMPAGGSMANHPCNPQRCGAHGVPPAGVPGTCSCQQDAATNMQRCMVAPGQPCTHPHPNGGMNPNGGGMNPNGGGMNPNGGGMNPNGGR